MVISDVAIISSYKKHIRIHPHNNISKTMLGQLTKIKQDIPKYQQIQQRLYDYLINKTITNLKITNEEYLESVDHVYNKSSGVGQRQKINKAGPPQNQLYQENFYHIYLEDLKKFAKCLVENLKQIATSQAWFYMDQVHQQIRAYKIFMHKLFKIFRHVDSNYLKGKSKDIHLQGAGIFKKNYIQIIYPNLFDKITELISKFKEGQHINNSVLQDVIYHIAICGYKDQRESLQINKSDQFSECFFKPKGWQPYQTSYFKDKFIFPMMTFLQKVYEKKSIELLKLSTPEYVKQSLRIIAIESKVADLFYDNDTPRKIIICSVSNTLANENGKTIMDNEKSGAYIMLQSQKYDQLHQLYILIKQSDLIPYLSQIFQKYIDKEGTMILQKITPQDQKQLKKQKVSEIVIKLLELKDLADHILAKSFNNDVKLQQGRDTALHTLINRTPKVTNFLCYYIDTQLKKQQDDSEAQNIITGVMKLFRYIYSTDAFFKTYQKLLCMRVLSDNLKNKDMEIDLISQFKAEAGAGALSKIGTMINDISNSEKFNQDFIKNNSYFNKDFQFKLMILTSGSWPIFNPKTGHENVPKQLIQPVQNKFSGKVLNWIFSHGSALLNAKFKTGSFLLMVGGFQIIILLLFADPHVEEVCIGDIIKKIKAQQIHHLNASILNLVRLKILLKDGQQGKIQISDKLRYNEQFSYKHRRVNCVPIQKNVQKMTPQITQQILKQRQTLIDSIIVKVMKARKVLKYQDCINETMMMCKIFKVELGFVKRRIQALIQKQFLKRDDKERNVLVYTP